MLIQNKYITEYGRSEFLEDIWPYIYQPGEHVALTGPTQSSGKTTLLFDLLDHTDTSWCSQPPTVIVAKPSDPTVKAGIERVGYKEISKWPPSKFKEALTGKPDGYALWPAHLKGASPEVNNDHLRRAIEPAITQSFWTGNNILVCDETYFLCARLKLEPELTNHWTQGAGMGSGLWDATQKPSGTLQGSIPTFRYNSATHTLLSRDPDANNRKRFNEIGGVDGNLVSEAVLKLKKYEWLYIHRDGPQFCIIRAN